MKQKMVIINSGARNWSREVAFLARCQYCGTWGFDHRAPGAVAEAKASGYESYPDVWIQAGEPLCAAGHDRN